MGIRGKGNGASWSGLVIIIALGTDEVHFFREKCDLKFSRILASIWGFGL